MLKHEHQRNVHDFVDLHGCTVSFAVIRSVNVQLLVLNGAGFLVLYVGHIPIDVYLHGKTLLDVVRGSKNGLAVDLNGLFRGLGNESTHAVQAKILFCNEVLRRVIEHEIVDLVDTLRGIGGAAAHTEVYVAKRCTRLALDKRNDLSLIDTAAVYGNGTFTAGVSPAHYVLELDPFIGSHRTEGSVQNGNLTVNDLKKIVVFAGGGLTRSDQAVILIAFSGKLQCKGKNGIAGRGNVGKGDRQGILTAGQRILRLGKFRIVIIVEVIIILVVYECGNTRAEAHSVGAVPSVVKRTVVKHPYGDIRLGRCGRGEYSKQRAQGGYDQQEREQSVEFIFHIISPYCDQS